MTRDVEVYFEEGCGRCALGGTPGCKVHAWREPMAELRRIVLESGLREESKWGVACYTWNGKNVLLLSAFKDFCCLSFFKGVLLNDPDRFLEAPGKHSQAARLAKFTARRDVLEQEPLLRSFIHEAIEAEKAGLKVDFKEKDALELPDELLETFAANPELEEAFRELTPGRQRGYVLYFSGARQSQTRLSRIEKYAPRILEGKGIHDR